MTDILSNQTNFRSLSLKDLLEARDLYHWHLVNKANVVGTAVGLYLIRKSDPWRKQQGAPDGRTARATRGERNFENSESGRDRDNGLGGTASCIDAPEGQDEALGGADRESDDGDVRA